MAKAKEKQAAVPEKEQLTEITAEPKFSIEQLRRHCLKLFNVTSSTFDGAFYGHEGEFTKAEAQEVITDWLSRKE